MYRKGSFGRSSNLRQRSSDATDPATEDIPTESSKNTLFLRTQGKFGLNNQLQPKMGGRLLTIMNYPVRNKMWKFRKVVFHPKTGTFVLADERGQIFRFSMHQTSYHALRMASTAVTAMCFLLTEKTHLIVAYANGTIVILDTHKSQILGNIQLFQPETKIIPIAKLIRCHPSKPLVAIITMDQKVFLWDLK
jgi:hypothetical protein